MKLPLRIGVLECDTPLAQTREKYGGYGGVFTALLKAGADALRSKGLSSKEGLDITCWDVVNEKRYPALEDLDAILISGSRYDSFTDVPWIVELVAFTQTVLAQQRVRLIGVCFGHQIIARAMGAPVGRSVGGWETSVNLVTLTEKGKELFGGLDVISLHQMHRDAVHTWPTGVEKLGSSPRCDVQGFYVKNRIVTVQGHPEFNQQIVTELLEARHEQGIFNDEQYEDGIKRVGNPHDGILVSQAFLRFLLED